MDSQRLRAIVASTAKRKISSTGNPEEKQALHASGSGTLRVGRAWDRGGEGSRDR